ncbi:Zinc finger, RING/FYVE/PHD-type [Sesbania bispinosa]|nr:Zinc finger, RING/FYVE/PHD-type [Sesbania bispinosa]
MTSLAVKVNRAKLSACLTCRLCNKWFKNATTISECLHTYKLIYGVLGMIVRESACGVNMGRECIDKKLIDEKLKNCPVCNVDLGCSPLDKLRADHSLQYLREKIFPSDSEEKSAKAPENVDSDTVPAKRKKKSPSSLKANARRAKAAAAVEVITPQEPELPASEPDKVEDAKQDEKQQSGIEILDEVSTILSARRAKAAARRKFIPYELTPPCQPDKVTGSEKKDDDCLQLETLIETSKTILQNCSKPDSSQEIVPNNKTSGDSGELWKQNADVMCEPMNFQQEIASKNKSHNKPTMQENAVIPVLVDSSDNDSQVPKVKEKKHCHRIEAASDKNESPPPPPKSDSLELKRLHSSTQGKTLQISEDLNLPAQPVIFSNYESNIRSRPVWLSLVASEEKDVGAQLPQLPYRYLRIKDGSLPVSFIKKYLIMKLGLASEAEVEISFQGQPVPSSLQLQSLVDLWLQTMPTYEIRTCFESSAKDFVMVLSYSRKA